MVGEHKNVIRHSPHCPICDDNSFVTSKGFNPPRRVIMGTETGLLLSKRYECSNCSSPDAKGKTSNQNKKNKKKRKRSDPSDTDGKGSVFSFNLYDEKVVAKLPGKIREAMPSIVTSKTIIMKSVVNNIVVNHYQPIYAFS